MRRRRIGGLIIALAVATSACSLVTSLDGLSSGIDATDGPRDAGAANDATDGPAEAEVAPPPTDAADALAIQDAGARDDAGPNLHPAGTFENGTCDPWHGFQGSIGFVTLARTGGGACRACTASTTTDYFTADDNGATGADMVGATYRAEGWVRTDPTAPAPLDVKLFLRNASVGLLRRSRIVRLSASAHRCHVAALRDQPEHHQAGLSQRLRRRDARAECVLHPRRRHRPTRQLTTSAIQVGGFGAKSLQPPSGLMGPFTTLHVPQALGPAG
jgi:hypothetical protein